MPSAAPDLSGGPTRPRPRGLLWLRLLLLSLLTLVIFRAVDTSLYRLLTPFSAWAATAADLRIPSLAVTLVLTAALRFVPRGRPVLPGRPDALMVAIYFVGFGVFYAFHVGRVALPRWEDRVAFLVTGLLTEELLCRGAVLRAALELWPEERPWRAVAWSTAVFGLLHHQHHGFRFDSGAWLQVAWTLPLGFVLALLTVRTRSLAPAVLLHVVNNLLVMLG